MDSGLQNEQWAAKIIDGLIQQKLNYFCCAPGSRSTPLMLAIAHCSQADRIMHFDERGVCFHALGYGKAKGKPAIVVTTSGTAVGNLLPAIMEAYNDRIPLLIITADRPPELQDCGANQTCDQVKLFTPYVSWEINLPCPSDQISDSYLASLLSHAVAMTASGPVHINCMFREPLFSEKKEPASLKKHVYFAHSRLSPSDATIEEWVTTLGTKRKGIILAASSRDDQTEMIASLSKRLNWPVFSDVISRANDASFITHFDPILKVKKEIAIDAVIQFGDRIVSKTLSQWLEKQNLEFYLHISEHLQRQDPNHLVTHRVHACPALFTTQLLKTLKSGVDTQWQQQWQEWDRLCKETLQQFFSTTVGLTEPGLIAQIASHLPKEWSLFLSNSMPIRDANQFLPRENIPSHVYANRGVSGIDGNIATAAGIAQGSNQPTFCLIGDLAMLHDINSLALLPKLKHPVILCVVNNQGGGIFSFLPIAKKSDHFEECFATSHSFHFSAAASLFQIPYHHPQNKEEFEELLSSRMNTPQSCIIEITTDRSENVQIHEHIQQTLLQCLSTAPEEILATHC